MTYHDWNNKRLFTDSKIRAIRIRFWIKGEGTGSIAKHFGVGRATIRRIIDRKTYKDVPPIKGEKHR